MSINPSSSSQRKAVTGVGSSSPQLKPDESPKKLPLDVEKHLAPLLQGKAFQATIDFPPEEETKIKALKEQVLLKGSTPLSTMASSEVTTLEGTKPSSVSKPDNYLDALPCFIAKSLFLAYAHLPLPPQDTPRKFLVLNESRGGMGDFAIAQQIIEAYAKVDPHAEIHWSVDKSEDHIKIFIERLRAKGLKVKIYNYNKKQTGFSPGEKIDQIIYCPLDSRDPSKTSYLADRFELSSDAKINFVYEIGSHNPYWLNESSDLLAAGLNIKVDNKTKNLEILKKDKEDDHPWNRLIESPYSTLSTTEQGLVIESLSKGALTKYVSQCVYLGLDISGGFFQTPPSTSESLGVEVNSEGEEKERGAIQLQAMQVIKVIDPVLYTQIHVGNIGGSEFHDKHGLGAGYAHQTAVKLHFIDVVVGGEKNQNLIFILSHKDRGPNGEKTPLEYFTSKMMTPERIAFLRLNNIGRVTCCAEGLADHPVVIDSAKPRSLRVILRETPMDQRVLQQLQKAADFQLGTGNSTPFEIWQNSRCLRSFMFDNVALRHDKDDSYPAAPGAHVFSEQQVNLATEIYPPLGEFLKLTSACAYTPSNRDAAIALFQDPKIFESLKVFKQRATTEYNVTPVIQGMIIRDALHARYPELAKIEQEALLSNPEIASAIKNEYFTKSRASDLSYPTLMRWEAYFHAAIAKHTSRK